MTEASNHTSSHNLTPKQIKALYYLLENMPMQQIARRLGVRRETISRWRHLPAFVAAYDSAVADMHRQLHHHSARLAELSLQCLQYGVQRGDFTLNEVMQVLNRVYPSPEPIRKDASIGQ